MRCVGFYNTWHNISIPFVCWSYYYVYQEEEEEESGLPLLGLEEYISFYCLLGSGHEIKVSQR
jgi:hypothetical protein